MIVYKSYLEELFIKYAFINTDDDKRTVNISKGEEEIRRELVLKNIGTSSNILEIISETATIDNQPNYKLLDGEAITIIFDGKQILLCKPRINTKYTTCNI
mgnify:CR=1 FL=1